jgi:hypothetical protein
MDVAQLACALTYAAHTHTHTRARGHVNTRMLWCNMHSSMAGYECSTARVSTHTHSGHTRKYPEAVLLNAQILIHPLLLNAQILIHPLSVTLRLVRK